MLIVKQGFKVPHRKLWPTN